MPEIPINVPAGGASITAAFAGGRQIPIFTNVGLTTQAPLPIALSATSRTTLYIGAVGSYDITVTDASGRVLEVADGIAMSVEPLVFVPAGSVSIADGSATYAALFGRSARGDINLAALKPATSGVSVTITNPGAAVSNEVFYNYQACRTRTRITGCVPIEDTTFGIFDNGVNASGAAPYAMEFDYYGAKFRISSRSINTQGGTWRLWVDGLPTTAGVFSPAVSPGGAGTVFDTHFDFGSVAHRRIRVEMNNVQTRGIGVSRSDGISPTPPDRFKIGIIGDSFVTGASGVDGLMTWASQIGRAFSAETFVAGQGGTGYVATGAGVPYTNATRLARMATAAPDLLIVFGTVNDGFSTAVEQAAATTVYSSFAASNPRMRIIPIGPPHNSGTPPAAQFTARDGLLAASQAASNVLAFVDPMTGIWTSGGGYPGAATTGGDGNQWINGTGRSGATTGDGNADVFTASDAVHPTQAGHDYYARRIVSAVGQILSAAYA